MLRRRLAVACVHVDDVSGGDLHVLEDDFGLLVAGDGLQDGDGDARLVARDDEGAQAAIRLPGDDVEVVGDVARPGRRASCR